jgi:hypothetical protein
MVNPKIPTKFSPYTSDMVSERHQTTSGLAAAVRHAYERVRWQLSCDLLQPPDDLTKFHLTRIAILLPGAEN